MANGALGACLVAATPRRGRLLRASSTVTHRDKFAGGKWGAAPDPQALPRPPSHWTGRMGIAHAGIAAHASLAAHATLAAALAAHASHSALRQLAV